MLKSQQVIKDSPPSSELSDVSLATIKVAEKAKIKKAKEGAKVTADAWTPIATTASSKKKKDKSLESKGMAETYLASSDEGMSKLGSPILPDKGPFNALRESLPSLEPTRTTRRETNVGVTPMEVNSRATSLALRSGMSTPVPIPVDRLTVPPKDPSATESREVTAGLETTHPSNQAPIFDNKQLEMYINMFHSQWFMYDEAKKTDDQVVMKAALNQAISSQELIRRVLSYEEMMDVCENWLAEAEMDIVFPKKRASNPLISSATQASTSTPSHQKGRSSPQEDVAMTYRDPTRCKQRLNQPHRPHQSTRPLTTRSRDERVELREPECDERSSSELHAKCDERPSPELCAGRDERPCSELRAELRDAVSAKPQPVYVRAPQTPSTPAGLTRYFTPSGPHLQQPSEPSEPPCSKGQVPLQPQRTSSTPASSSSAAARHPLPCSTPARWKLRGIQEEKEESPTGRQHGSSLGSGKCLLESRKDLREDAKSPGKSECSKQESPKSTSSPVDPYMNLSFNPALEQLSDASQKEFLLSNINNRLVHDNPFLIEDKLQKLFSTFLSDLSGTIDAFPSTLLESCVEKLSSTINSSILELIKSEITPILLDDTLHKLRELRREEKSSPDTCQTESLKDFINEKIDCLQDIIAINDGQQKTDIDIMRREFSQMEHRLFNNFSSITNQLNDLSNNENDRFEQVKRRIGAVNNQIENLKSEVHTLTNDAHSKGRESPLILSTTIPS
ncbi:hypothetical protein H4Q26_013837 [Puccinia striiformis f. sp. tritici PST-130]|nr:hypothetical protein H4Q26_013837 [Puccinia striiformis f. sp. tritici PST-130]